MLFLFLFFFFLLCIIIHLGRRGAANKSLFQRILSFSLGDRRAISNDDEEATRERDLLARAHLRTLPLSAHVVVPSYPSTQSPTASLAKEPKNVFLFSFAFGTRTVRIDVRLPIAGAE